MSKTNSTMKNMFKGYSNYEQDEFNKIWSDGLIVVDTNILLNFYRYSADTRKDFIKVLRDLKDRLWIPYQVGKEYFNNKNKVMSTSYNDYDSLATSIKQQFQSAINSITSKKSSQLKCKEDLIKLIDADKQKIQEILDKEKSLKKPNFSNNTIESEIFDLFNDSIGEPFTSKEMETIKAEGLRRMENDIPPGYKDKDKEENGDYYIFYSLIQKAKSSQRDIIFITDDEKEDWFNTINGEKHGGRYEILNEFFHKTGKLLLIYNSNSFIKYYTKHFSDTVVDENTLKELAEVRREDLRAMHAHNILINNINIDYDLASLKNSLLEVKDKNDLKEILNKLEALVRKSDLSLSKKTRLYYKLSELYKIKLIPPYMPVLNIIYELEDSNISYRVSLPRILHRYRHILNRLKCEDGEDRIVYRRLYFNISDHIQYLMNNNKGNYELTIELQHLQEVIQQILDKPNYAEKLKERIIATLELILSICSSEI